MKLHELISKKHRHLLYKDEVGDEFLLTEFGEIYLYSGTMLCVLSFSYKIAKNLLPIAKNSDYTYLGDDLYRLYIKAENIEKILAFSKRSNRFQKGSKFLKKAEERLAHKIIPYRPKELSGSKDGLYRRYKNLLSKNNFMADHPDIE